MNDIKFMLSLIRGAVYTKDYPDNADADWEFIYNMSVSHSVANVIAYAILEGGYNVPPEIKSQFTKKMYEGVTVCENQTYELNRIFSEFEKNEIRYMPIKGTLIRKLYPSADMRSMSDADILINPDDFEKFNKLMTDAGYTFVGESNHEYNYMKKPFVHIELHKYLVPSYNDDLYAYYGDGWKLANPVGDSKYRFELSTEDHFIYIITHFAKHYRDAGVGLKSVVDIWLYMKKHTNMDMEYVKGQLEKMNLLIFANNLFKMIYSWFENKPDDDITVAMSVFILKSTTFGTYENQMLAQAIRDYQGSSAEKISNTRYRRALFPNIEHMKLIYPILKKAPILLPFLWIARIIKRVFFGKKGISEHIKKVDILDNDNINNFKNHIEAVGLDIYNGRESL